MALIKVFFWGMLISFLGTLPLSPLNISAMQISTGEGIANATWFSIGTLLTEMIYVRISVAGINWLQKQKSFFKWMEWITVFLILALAFGSFYAASHKHETGNIILHNNINRFLLGMFMSAITVMHIPFWFGWTTILFSKKILHAGNLFYNVYAIAIGTGTFLANCIFI
jgi:threonine/homoserine/homoserine lactone efflux protein